MLCFENITIYLSLVLLLKYLFLDQLDKGGGGREKCDVLSKKNLGKPYQAQF